MNELLMSIDFQPFITSEYIQPHAEVLGESGKTLPQWAGLDSLLFEMDRNLDHYSLESHVEIEWGWQSCVLPLLRKHGLRTPHSCDLQQCG